ncbi:MAG: cation:proton antiporter [Planctomycetes bacterium SM23_32]|nr:MAG: cation:proton antiporter [Planctomycetes bacterium SM23_32]
MRRLISLSLLLIVALGISLCFSGAYFGAEGANRAGKLAQDRVNFGQRYNSRGLEENGAGNIVASVVVNYRGFDTLGEVTVLFIAAVGLAVVLSTRREKPARVRAEPASLVVFTGCRFLFPLILLLGSYIFIHGHLTPGGGFQGGAVVASGFLLVYLGCRGKGLRSAGFTVTESLSGLAFVVLALVGLAVGGSLLLNFLPKGSALTLFSGGVIPIIYVAIGLKVGSELGSIIANLSGEAP